MPWPEAGLALSVYIHSYLLVRGACPQSWMARPEPGDCYPPHTDQAEWPSPQPEERPMHGRRPKLAASRCCLEGPGERGDLERTLLSDSLEVAPLCRTVRERCHRAASARPGHASRSQDQERVHTKPWTLNPKPKPPNPQPQTPNPKPQTPKPQTPNPKPYTINPEPQPLEL